MGNFEREQQMRTARAIELPSLESLPHTTCKLCDRSLINGLFRPAELSRPEGPRCMKCLCDLSEKARQNKGAWRNLVGEEHTLKGRVSHRRWDQDENTEAV